MLEFLIMLTLMVRPAYSTVLLLIQQPNQPGQLSVIYIVIALVDYLYIAKHCLFSEKTKNTFWVSLIILIVILGMMAFTGVYYKDFGGEFLSALLSYASLSMAAFLLGFVFIEKNDFTTLRKVLPFFILMLTFVSTEAVIKTLKSWDGLVHAETINDINYQNCTYYAAYALGLNLYQLTSLHETNSGINKKTAIIAGRILLVILLPVQLFTVLCGGGRGGFLLAVGMLLYFALVILRDNRRKAGYTTVIMVMVLIVAAALIAYFSVQGDTIRGFSRITKFLSSPKDNDRNKQYVEAIEYFLSSPIIGNGIGSVWFTLGFYSHDIFTDLLCEGGVLWTGTFVLIMIWYTMKEVHMILENKAYRFGLIIFLFAFVMLLFSGYYLTEPMFWFGLAFTLCADLQKCKKTPAGDIK